MSWISEESNRLHQRVPDDLIAAAQRQAKESLEADEMGDD
jgi:hypothetical protein